MRSLSRCGSLNRLHLCRIHDSLWLWSVQHTWLVVGRLVFLLISVSSFWCYSRLIYFQKGLHNSSLNAGWQQCGKLQWNVMCNVCVSVGRFPAHSLSLQEKGQKTKQKTEWRHHCQYLIKPEQMQDSNVCVWITYLKMIIVIPLYTLSFWHFKVFARWVLWVVLWERQRPGWFFPFWEGRLMLLGSATATEHVLRLQK